MGRVRVRVGCGESRQAAVSGSGAARRPRGHARDRQCGGSSSPCRAPRRRRASERRRAASDFTMKAAMSTAGIPPTSRPKSPPIEALLSDEARAGDRHEEGAGPHHDRERRRRVHAEEADEDHARRVEADAERHQRAEEEVDADRHQEPRPVRPSRLPPAGRARRAASAS